MTCAIISTACLVYFVFHVEYLKKTFGYPPGDPLLLSDPEKAILERLKKPKSN
jgi:hypothetical protein